MAATTTQIGSNLLADIPELVVAKHAFLDNTWRNLLLNPKDKDHLKDLVHAVENEPHKVWNHLDKVRDTLPGDLKRFLPVTEGSWANCIHNQYCHPKNMVDVSSLDDIKAAIADARDNNLQLRAAGSGVILTTHNLKKTLDVPTDTLKDPNKLLLYSVEAGITIKELNERLDKAGLALINMGAYDGQTLAGAISTGTHGSGIKLGPIASCIQSITLVTEKGEVLQLEPKDGITDPAKFKSGTVTLKQDDDYFYAAMVAMGCLGVIYSYTIQVEKLYYLVETRQLTTWEELKPKLVTPPGKEFPDLLEDNRHFELLINPYVVKGKHNAITVIRNKAVKDQKEGSRGLLNWLSGLLAQSKLAATALVSFLNWFPDTSPGIINSALNSLVDKDYVDKSYVVLDIGAVDDVKALAMELYSDAKDFVTQVDKVLKFFEQAAKDMKWFLAGPVAVRFTAPSPALVASEAGRYTCAIELDMLVGINTGMELLKQVSRNVVEDSPSVRIHWGLDLDTVDHEFNEKNYPNYNRWMAVYKELNSTGLFNSPLTDRLGISVKSA